MKPGIYFLTCLLSVIFVTAYASSGQSSGHGGASSGIKAEDAIRLLKEGNGRYFSGKPSYPNQDSYRRAETVKDGQKPFVTILSCSDSRVPVELLFDAGIGDLFVIRVAGNVADTDEIGTVEYGVEHLGTPLLLVLGHSRCGAVTAVYNNDHVGGSIPALVDNIVPAVERIKKDNHGSVDGAIRENVWQTISDIFSGSAIVRELVEKGALKVVGGYYDLEKGTVALMGEHPVQKELLEGKSHGQGTITEWFWYLGVPFTALVFMLAGYMLFVSNKRLVKTIRIKGRLVSSVVLAALSAGVTAILAQLSPLDSAGRLTVLTAGLIVTAATGIGYARSMIAAMKIFIDAVRQGRA